MPFPFMDALKVTLTAAYIHTTHVKGDNERANLCLGFAARKDDNLIEEARLDLYTNPGFRSGRFGFDCGTANVYGNGSIDVLPSIIRDLERVALQNNAMTGCDSSSPTRPLMARQIRAVLKAHGCPIARMFDNEEWTY
jgi:hypothetical protein